MCKRFIRRLNLFLLAVSVTFIMLNCKGESTNEELNEIYKISKIKLPENSKLLKYYDNNEFQIVFEISLQKKEVIKFIKKYKFRKIESKVNKFSKTSSDSYIVRDIENGFIPPIEIVIDNKTLIYTHSNSELILNSEKLILYGLINY